MEGLACIKKCGCITERIVDVEGYDTPQPLCIWCEDGEVCPTAADKAAEPIREQPKSITIRVPNSKSTDLHRGKPSHKKKPTQPTPREEEGGWRLEARVVSVQEASGLDVASPSGRSAAVRTRKDPVMREKKQCRFPGPPTCKNMTSSKRGCCDDHYYWATKNPEKKESVVLTTLTNAGLPEFLALAPVYLTAAALDRIWSTISLEEKAAMITDHMAKIHPSA